MFEKIYAAKKQCIIAMNEFADSLNDNKWQKEKKEWQNFINNNDYDFIKSLDDFQELWNTFDWLFMGYEEHIYFK